jgi:hypothetical protein
MTTGDTVTRPTSHLKRDPHKGIGRQRLSNAEFKLSSDPGIARSIIVDDPSIALESVVFSDCSF